MKSIYLLLVWAAFLISCKNQKPEESVTATETQDSTSKYTLTPFTTSHDFPDATLRSIDYKKGKFIAEIGGTTYKLGVQTPDAPQKQCANSTEGQHLHLIVNNEPYVAKYTPTFNHTIPDGNHYILTFLSRSYHESLKTPAAHKVLKATVKDTSFERIEPIEGPMIFYSRPKGLYVGDDTKKVMLDFYLVNAEEGSHKVEADINGEKHMLDTWQPYYIEGLPEGDNTITLSLLDSAGRLLNVPLNPVSRTFKLEKSPAAN